MKTQPKGSVDVSHLSSGPGTSVVLSTVSWSSGAPSVVLPGSSPATVARSLRSRRWQFERGEQAMVERRVLATKAVEARGRGTASATKAVEAQGRGSDLATKAAETQGRGTNSEKKDVPVSAHHDGFRSAGRPSTLRHSTGTSILSPGWSAPSQSLSPPPTACAQVRKWYCWWIMSSLPPPAAGNGARTRLLAPRSPLLPPSRPGPARLRDTR